MRTDLDDRRWRSWPHAGAHGGYVCAFGEQVEDLAVDFSALPQPLLVDVVLSRCLRSGEGNALGIAELRSWAVTQRLQGLIAVALASDVDSLSAAPECPNCGERFQIDVAVRDFERRDEPAPFEWTSPDGAPLLVRVPTGQDQAQWLAAGVVEARAMARQLVQTVNDQPPAADWELPPTWVDELAERLALSDPLTALELQTHCPACDASVFIEFDLEAQLLARLGARQFAMLRDVHVLASVYHWSEDAILRLPAWRRGRYLALLGAGGEP